MRVLFVDAGWSSIGYCVFENGIRQNYGEFHFSQKDKIARISAIKAKLENLIKTESVDSIVCEDFRVHSGIGVKAQNVLLMIGLLVGIAQSLGVKIDLVNFGHWKAKWKKIVSKPDMDGFREHEKDAIMMGVALLG